MVMTGVVERLVEATPRGFCRATKATKGYVVACNFCDALQPSGLRTSAPQTATLLSVRSFTNPWSVRVFLEKQ